MNDGLFSQNLVFYPKGRWFSAIFGVFCLIVGTGFVWSEALYILAGVPGNLPSNPVYQWMWGNPGVLDLWKFQYRLVCYFPCMIFLCVYSLFMAMHRVFFTKLIVGQDGIAYQAPGYCVKAKWSEFEKIDKKRFLFKSTEGLFPRAGVTLKKTTWFPIWIFTNWSYFIPLDDFGKKSSQPSLNALISRYINLRDVSGNEIQ